jgi:hypothetical protein
MATAHMINIRKQQMLIIIIATVWFVNGLVCKLLNIVPRHQEIVARILGDEHAAWLTRTIGALEIAMGFWIVSGIYRKLNVALQVIVVVTMNVLETILAPDLLLWGRFNLLFAMLFVLLIFFNEFYLRTKPANKG